MALPQLTGDTAFLAEEKNRYHTHCRRAKFVCEHLGKAHFGGVLRVLSVALNCSSNGSSGLDSTIAWRKE